MEKKKEWKPEELEDKTVYDFCDDEEILEELIGAPEPLSEDVRSNVMQDTPLTKIQLIFDLSGYAGYEYLFKPSKVLRDKLLHEYEEYVRKHNNKNGLIID